MEKSPRMAFSAAPPDFELENIQGLSGSSVNASYFRNLDVKNFFSGSQVHDQEAELEAMRQVVKRPAPPQFRSSFHEEQEGNTSAQHESSAKQSVSRQVSYESSALSSSLKIPSQRKS
jgi:hypothetical protein